MSDPTVKVLRPFDPIRLPKCCAPLAPAAYMYRRNPTQKDKVCQNFASVCIDGKNYCKKHGGIVALQILTNGES